MEAQLQAEKALADALERSKLPHSNKHIEKFLQLHSEEPPVLIMNDPWTVAPDAPLLRQGEAPPDPEQNLEEGLDAARKALGAAGLEEMRRLEVDEVSTTWEQLHMRMESAKES